MKKRSKRNYGIDLLRMVAMYMVIILHVMYQGGILGNLSGNTEYAVSWFIETVAYCAVDCYAIVSGYVGYREEEKPYNYR